MTTEKKMSIPAEFRAKYRERGPDDVATQIAAHCPDLVKLRALAERNGIDFSRYASLNPGQQRMNTGNKLRAMARRGEPIAWEAPEQPAAPAKPAKPKRAKAAKKPAVAEVE